MVVKAGRKFGKALAGDHIIGIYRDNAELFEFIVPFIRAGLAKSERCLYLAAETRRAEIVDALSARGVRIEREIKRGAFLLTPPVELFGSPPFDPARAIERMLGAEADAASAGFTGLRVVGDWAWSLPENAQGDELIEFESLLDRAVESRRLTIACMYRRDSTDSTALVRLTRLHSKVIANDYVLLSLSPLFGGLPPAELQALARSARERVIRKGEFYFHQGEPAKDVFVLTGGTVKLVRTVPTGEAVILRVVAAVQHFGDGRVGLDEAVRFASAEALEDSRALAWDSAVVLQVILKHPDVGVNVIRWLQQLMEEERVRLEDFLSADVKRRLARLFLRLGQSIGRKTRRGLVIEVPLSRRDLAELAITSPFTVSRILAEWRRLDILDAQRTRILIQDPDALAAVAEDRGSAPGARSRIS